MTALAERQSLVVRPNRHCRALWYDRFSRIGKNVSSFRSLEEHQYVMESTWEDYLKTDLLRSLDDDSGDAQDHMAKAHREAVLRGDSDAALKLAHALGEDFCETQSTNGAFECLEAKLEGPKKISTSHQGAQLVLPLQFHKTSA